MRNLARQDFQVVSRDKTHSTSKSSLRERARTVAAIAAESADRTDAEAVFPETAISAARLNGLLAAIVPVDLGGEGATISDMADVCFIIGRACASAGMIVSMHVAALACIVRHHSGNSWQESFLRKVARDGLLLASSTTEGAGGGNVRSSSAALVHNGAGISLERAATVVSYGAQADGIVTVARRDVDRPASDQTLTVFLKDRYSLVPTNCWHTLGMRGTCSLGFALKAHGDAEQMLSTSYEKIHAQTMVPVSHMMWGAVWTGIAAAAVERARLFVKAASKDGQMPPGVAQYTRAVVSLRSLQAVLKLALVDFETIQDNPERLMGIGAQTTFNLVKVDLSEKALATVSLALRACGLAGYRSDGPFSIARHLRDVLSAPIMIHNDRILANLASTTLLGQAPLSLDL